MKIICAWCKRNMGEKDGKGVQGTSHTCCVECKVIHFPKYMTDEDWVALDQLLLRQEGRL